jgi:hypothetical protein
MPFQKRLARVFLVIDKGGAGKPHQQRQTLKDLFEYAIKSRGTHVTVRVRDSHLDRGLQAVDFLTHFASEEFRAHTRIAETYGLQEELAPKARLRRLKGFKIRLHDVKAGKQILKGKLHLWRIPPGHLYARSLRRLVSARIEAIQQRKRNEANRRG